MIYDYNIITGLNYYSCELELFYIELTDLPQMNKEELLYEWRKLIKETSIQLVDSTKPEIEDIFYPIYSNIPYEIL